MSRNISDLKLEQWLLGELSKEEASHIEAAIEQDPQLQSRIDAMKSQTQELFQQYPPDRFQKDVKQKLHLWNTQEQYDISKQRPRWDWGTLTGVLVFALSLFVVVPFLGGDGSSPKKEDPFEDLTVRTKGETQHLMAHLVGAEVQKQLLDGDSVKAGDRIQLSINKARGLSFVVFSIDGHGTMSVHYPRESTSKIEESDFFSLPTSYRLDDAPDFENFYLIFVILENF